MDRIKYWLVFVLTWYASMPVFCQKHDYVWLSGYDSNVGFDSHWGFRFGTSELNFNTLPRAVSYDSLRMNFDKTNISFCDSDGNLLFYSNGVYIANSLDEKIENGDSLNAGWFQYDFRPLVKTYGYRAEQALISLPKVGQSNKYYLFHGFYDSIPNLILYCSKILVTELDMDLNANHGKVTSKNEIVIEDSLGIELCATRHGNGKDWWILVHEDNSNCYYRILLDETGHHVLAEKTCGGSTPPPNDIAAACFSPDGSKYVYQSYGAGLNIFDFDRCTGVLSTPVIMPTLKVSGWLGRGVAISPNNRFLYVFNTYNAFQFDLFAPDIIATLDTIGIFDGTSAPFEALFNNAQLGPDGKIYIGCGNSDTVYHVVNQPDLPGAQCDFRQHSLSLPSPSLGVPNFPNYRLGALPGSACDTLTGLNDDIRAEKEKQLKVYPNPANDVITIDYGYTNWNKGVVQLDITNAMGQTIYTQTLPMYSGFQKLNVSQYVPGIYTAFIKRNGKTVAAQKWVKE